MNQTSIVLAFHSARASLAIAPFVPAHHTETRNERNYVGIREL